MLGIITDIVVAVERCTSMLMPHTSRPSSRAVIPWLVLGAWLVLQPSVLRNGWEVVTGPFTRARQLLPSLRTLATPEAGLDQLPSTVRDARTLLREAGAHRYRIAEPLASNDELTQRLIESAWPIRVDAAARVTILHADTPVPTGCQQVSARGAVKLARCD